MKVESVDVLIIGAGPSGGVAAAYLAKHDLNVKIVEKAKFPRFAIGESLLPRCMDHFDEVGLLEALKSRGYEVKKGARFLKDDNVCHFDFSDKYSDGWNWTWQAPRADFDFTIAKEIKRMGVEIEFESTVTDIQFNEDGSSVTEVINVHGITNLIHSKFLIDSSGFGRVLPRLLDLEKPTQLPKLGSIFTHVKELNRPNGEEGTLITFDVVSDDSWIWVIPFSNGITSIGYVGPIEVLESIDGGLDDKMKLLFQKSKHYNDRFNKLDFEFEPIEIKNYSKSVKQLYGNGFVLTGNSAEFLDPVFSSGVTFATESGLLAAKLVTKQLQGQTVDWEKEFSDYIREGVNVFSTYVKEWYTGNLQTIFFHPNSNKDIKRYICSVLAGYVWDNSNPFVRNHDRLVKTVAEFINLETTNK